MSHPPKRAMRGDWGTAVPVDEDLWRLRLHNPQGALLVNTYVYAGPNTLAVIDPGWPWSLDGLEAALRALGLARSTREVDAWLYTHSHIDHMGAAALLGARGEGRHVVSGDLEPHLERWHAFLDRANDWTGWAGEAFAPPRRDEIVRGMRARRQADELMVATFGELPVRHAQLVEVGEVVQVGDLRLEVHDARGHDPTHIAFFEPDRGWLFSGDAVIATPTPICRAMDDDLELYRQTLTRLRDLPARVLMPGHGIHRSGELSTPFERSLGHVERYREQVVELLDRQDGRPADLYDLALAATPKGRPLEPTGRWWVHIALVDSHLQALVAEGLVERVEGPRYAAT